MKMMKTLISTFILTIMAMAPISVTMAFDVSATPIPCGQHIWVSSYGHGEYQTKMKLMKSLKDGQGLEEAVHEFVVSQQKKNRKNVYNRVHCFSMIDAKLIDGEVVMIDNFNKFYVLSKGALYPENLKNNEKIDQLKRGKFSSHFKASDVDFAASN